MNIFDAHNDFLTVLNQKKAFKYIDKLKDIHLCSAIWTTQLNEVDIFRLINEAYLIEKEYNKTLISIEDCGFLNSKNYYNLIKYKPFSASLVWNEDNALGGGAFGHSDLTKRGKNLVNRFERDGIYVDLAHTNEKTFYSIARISQKPLFCSHCGFYSLKQHERNLKDYQIKMIVDSGGMIGLAMVVDFLSENKTAKIDDICNQILFFANKYGINNLCLGTDFFGTKNTPKGINKYSDIKKLKDSLTKLGFSASDIEQIFYRNLENFISTAYQT